ncbi:MAG TPA: SRPBCC family protein [Agriterribacter sp.]|nr:SRPBCC family protein [Agriterribacter sp.]
MKKALKIIGVIVLLIIAFVLIAGLFVSKAYHLEKDITINAPREKVWRHVSSLREMEKWNPWREKDPNIKADFEGQDGTVGSVYKWSGNKDVGSGSQTITKLEQPDRVETHLHFIEPFEGEADAFTRVEDTGNGTKVTWGFDTRYAYPMNTMLLFIDMDEMMGKDYNNGLAKLKTLCEAE